MSDCMLQSNFNYITVNILYFFLFSLRLNKADMSLEPSTQRVTPAFPFSCINYYTNIFKAPTELYERVFLIEICVYGAVCVFVGGVTFCQHAV